MSDTKATARRASDAGLLAEAALSVMTGVHDDGSVD